MNLGFFALVAAVAASYRLTRLVVVDTIFDKPRSAAEKWLLRGESSAARINGWYLAMCGAFGVVIVATARVAGRITNDGLALGLAICLGSVATGAVVGYRYYVAELIGCKWCVGVWTSAAVAASLSLWGHWPIVPTCVFALATAGFQCFLNLGEDLLAAVIEGLDDANDERLEAAVET